MGRIQGMRGPGDCPNFDMGGWRALHELGRYNLVRQVSGEQKGASSGWATG